MQNMTLSDLVLSVGGECLSGKTNLPIQNVEIDSRKIKPGDLFVALVGEQVDGHDFILQARKKGAVAILVQKKIDEVNDSDIAFVFVEDTKKALQALAQYYRKKFRFPLLAVTGSVGKTSTKEMLAHALSSSFLVAKSPGNQNSQIGLPLSLCSFNLDAEIAVLEMGMSEVGELVKLSYLVQPDLSIITNIGLAHVGQVGSQQAICREKMSIIEGMPKGGRLLLNGDDPFLQKEQKNQEKFREKQISVFSYGIDFPCDYRAENIEEFYTDREYTRFRFISSSQQADVCIPLVGKHHVYQAMATLATVCLCEADLKGAIERLAEYEGVAGRQKKIEKRGITFLDDTYNASPESMEAGLELLLKTKIKGKKIAVLADMKELGEKSKVYHYQFGVRLAKTDVSCLFVFGEDAKEIAKAVREHNKKIAVQECDSLVELLGELRTKATLGDCVWLKGSHSMGLHKVLENILAE
ncbi:UDP-N-acetylmuramoyl-tripeptide--D-alanyl-D-alanine ligase [Clostridia bacterium]|nr:UDP-N-acetylmuramoyl-tripeptide--D-alanyl-D-alanine ligase [Clostridia bacterium]